MYVCAYVVLISYSPVGMTGIQIDEIQIPIIFLF